MQQQSRLASQSELAALDMSYLGNYRRDLIECQTKLFMLTLTLGVTLAGAYFALNYHSVATNQLANPNLSFWRTMVAQKSISIQRIDTYLMILKECRILNQYPREYRGWESAIRKYRHLLNTNICTSCGNVRRCGTLKPEDQHMLRSRSFLRSPSVDLYHVVMYTSFFGAFALSIFAIVVELLNFQWGIPVFMLIAVCIAAILCATVAALIYVFYHLRKGHFSVEYFKFCWIDLLNRCRWQV